MGCNPPVETCWFRAFGQFWETKILHLDVWVVVMGNVWTKTSFILNFNPVPKILWILFKPRLHKKHISTGDSTRQKMFKPVWSSLNFQVQPVDFSVFATDFGSSCWPVLANLSIFLYSQWGSKLSSSLIPSALMLNYDHGLLCLFLHSGDKVNFTIDHLGNKSLNPLFQPTWCEKSRLG